MIYLVNQGQTYNEERKNEILWSPKLTKDGKSISGYYLMNEVKKDDFIIHSSKGKIVAISVVKKDCYDAIQPLDIKKNSGDYDWDDDGYCVETKYYDLTYPISNRKFKEKVKKDFHKDSCFQIDGRMKLRYLCNIDLRDAKMIVDEILKTETDKEVIKVLEDIIKFLKDSDPYHIYIR